MKTNRYLILVIVAAITIVSVFLIANRQSTHGATPLVKFVPEPPMRGPDGVAVPGPRPDLPIQVLTINNVSRALTIYAEFTRAELLIEPDLLSTPVSFKFSNTNSGNLSREEGVRLFEEALRREAGFVFEHRDAQQVIVRRYPASTTR